MVELLLRTCALYLLCPLAVTESSRVFLCDLVLSAYCHGSNYRQAVGLAEICTVVGRRILRAERY